MAAAGHLPKDVLGYAVLDEEQQFNADGTGYLNADLITGGVYAITLE